MTLSIHAELTADRKSVVLMATGEDIEIRNAARRLPALTPLLKPKPPGGMIMAVTFAGCVQLAHTFEQAWSPGPVLSAWLAEQMTARFVAGPDLSYTPPAGLVPRPYQVEGALMIAATGRALIFDDPGTGKTITAILGLVERHARDSVLPVVCVVPASVVDPWVAAWRLWAPHWRTVAWRGIPRKRLALAGTADVYVTSYDYASLDAKELDGPLLKLKARGVVVDECHLIKTPDAVRSLASRRLARKAAAFVALSGTPITHHPGNIWPVLEALDHAAWPSRERFINRYCSTVQGSYSEQIIGLAKHTEGEFRQSLTGQHRRVAKADVLTQLPPKVYSTRIVELPPEYRKAYDQMAQRMLAELPSGEELSVMSVLPQLTRLAQLASAAAEVITTTAPDEKTGELVEHVSVRLRAPSWKVDELLAVLDERPGEQVVVFAPSRQLVILAGERAAKAGYRVGYVIGDQTHRQRTETVDAFQASELDVLCATTQAGGVGLTLTAARTVVFLQRPWSLVDALQAEDRCHRIGSEHHESIEIIDIIANKTIDSEIRGVLRDKAGALAELLKDPRIVTELLGGK